MYFLIAGVFVGLPLGLYLRIKGTNLPVDVSLTKMRQIAQPLSDRYMTEEEMQRMKKQKQKEKELRAQYWEMENKKD